MNIRNEVVLRPFYPRDGPAGDEVPSLSPAKSDRLAVGPELRLNRLIVKFGHGKSPASIIENICS